MAATHDWSIARRQPPAAIFMVLQKVLLQTFRVMWPFLLIWIFKNRDGGASRSEILLLAVSVFIFINSLLEYWFFRFSIPGQELVVKKGFWVKRTIVLPLQKIQAVHIEQNWLHRLLKLSQVTLDSPGSKNAEVKIAMNRNSAESLRAFILESGMGASINEMTTETAMPQARPFFIMEPFDLLKLGISANHLEAFFILLAFGFSVLDDIETAAGQQYEGAMKWLSEQAEGSTVSAAIVFAGVVLVISIIASFVRIVLGYANFRISKTDKGFRIQSGLVNTREKLVPFRKVQYISWRANWIRNKINFYLLQFHAIGTMETRRKWEIKVPVTRSSLLPQLLTDYHPELPGDAPSIRIHKAYIGRRTIFLGIVPALLLSGITYTSFGSNAFWFFLLIGYVFISSWLLVSKFRLLIDKEAMQVHRSIFGREEILLKWNHIQSVKLRQSLYQRSRGLATVRLYTAGGVIQVPFVRLEQAEQIRDYALFKVESDLSSWM
jgi:putative membrane protein